MSFKPILFSTAMVQAILQGQKTQTRRVVKYSKEIKEPKIGFTTFTGEGEFSVRGLHQNGEYGESFFKMKIQKGNILWVRETFQVTDWEHPTNDNYGYIYKASENGKDWEDNNQDWKWKPSIFMPKEACRLFLEVTDVRVERLQDISHADAKAEGIESYQNNQANFRNYNYTGNNDPLKFNFLFAGNSFKSLWESINGRDSWNANPWVWVYEFKKINKPENFI